METLTFVADNGIHSVCGIQIKGDVAVVTELGGNQGVSVTNGICKIVEVLCSKLNVGAKDITVIEHYGPMSYLPEVIKEDTYDLVGYDVDEKGKPVRPKWQRISQWEAEAIYGDRLSLKD